MIQKEVKFSEAARFIRRCFPEASVRKKVKIRTRKTYQVSDYWSEGSRNFAAFVNLETGEVLQSYNIPQEFIQKEANPFNLPIARITLSDKFAVVEHTIFCGKDLGYTIYVGEDGGKLLDQRPELLGLPAAK